MSTDGIKPERKRLAVPLATGFAELSYAAYEPPKAVRTVLCIPDFLGNSGDFSRLAMTLAMHGFRVICPDLPGRGASAYLNVADYNPHTYMLSLLVLAQSLGSSRLMVIGKGWGGLLALGLARQQEVTVSRLILADLGFPWKLTVDAAIAEAAVGPGLPTLAEGRRLWADSSEFAGLPPAHALPLVDGRLRQTDTGYGLDFDPALLTPEATDRFARIRITPLFEGIRAKLLYMTAGALSQRERTHVRSIMSAGPNRSYAENLTQAERIHFVSSHELLLTLGFLLSRALPAL